MTTTAQQLFDAAFAPEQHRTPRSPAYKAGVLAVLRLYVDGARARQPYPLGTAEADAYFSGCEEGHRIARGHGLQKPPLGRAAAARSRGGIVTGEVKGGRA